MRIEAYFEQIKNLVDDCPFVQSSNLTYEKRSSFEGFVLGEVVFIDNSTLHLREFVDVEATVERLMYVYHYMDARQSFRFRYDNTGHHKKKNLSTYPHHKHNSKGKKVVPAFAPSLADVLEEIQGLIELP